MKLVKVDLHNHLGKNGVNPGFDETIDIAYNSIGPGGIFGICNDGPTDYRYEKFIEQSGGKYSRIQIGDKKRAIYVPERQITVVGVEEVEPKRGHFVVAGMPANAKLHRRKTAPIFEDALKEATDLGTVKVVVHPEGRDGLGSYLRQHRDLLDEFDAWEVWNATAELVVPKFLPQYANKMSLEHYLGDIRTNYDIGACAFTDGHSYKIIGKSHTKIPSPSRENEETFMSKLRNGLRANKSTTNLHRRPAKWDAFKHCYHMAKYMTFGSPY